MCIRDRATHDCLSPAIAGTIGARTAQIELRHARSDALDHCLLYTSDAADERSSVDLGGRRIIKKKKSTNTLSTSS